MVVDQSTGSSGKVLCFVLVFVFQFFSNIVIFRVSTFICSKQITSCYLTTQTLTTQMTKMVCEQCLSNRFKIPFIYIGLKQPENTNLIVSMCQFRVAWSNLSESFDFLVVSAFCHSNLLFFSSFHLNFNWKHSQINAALKCEMLIKSTHTFETYRIYKWTLMHPDASVWWKLIKYSKIHG